MRSGAFYFFLARKARCKIPTSASKASLKSFMRGRVERPPALLRRVKMPLVRVFGRRGDGSIPTYVTEPKPPKAE